MKKLILLVFLSVPARLNSQEILVKDVEELVNIISHPSLAGRGTDQPGFDIAGEIIARELRIAGLQSLPQVGDYFHEFAFNQVVASEESSLEIIGIKSYEYEKDFLSVSISDNISVEGNIAFVGFGISSEEDGYDDYENIDVRGKIVVMFRHEPHESINDPDFFNGSDLTEHSRFDTKKFNAQRHDAVGMIIIEDGLNHLGKNDPIDVGFRNDKRRFGIGTLGPSDKLSGSNTFPIFSVSLKTANELSGTNVLYLQEDIEREKKPRSYLRDHVFVKMEFKNKTISHESRNILGYLAGKESDEYIIIGAHYDHLGSLDEGIYPGADDNASGTAGVLAVAKALSKNKKFRRNIIFAFWGAEEWGLMGSKSFVHDDVIPLDQIQAVINLDMIGRNEPTFLNAIGAEMNETFEQSSPQIYQALTIENRKLANPFQISLAAEDNIFYRTDSAAFFLASPEGKRIPILFLTSGMHDDYHQMTDTAEKIDAGKVANISQLTLGVLISLSDMKDRPKYR